MSHRVARIASFAVVAPLLGGCTAEARDLAPDAPTPSPASTPVPAPARKPPAPEPEPKLDLDVPHPEMVEVRTSLIPGAGQGLFARKEIPENTNLGVYRGEYVTPEQSDAMQGTKEGEYLFFLPDCAQDEVHDAIAGDMNDYVSKVNYAPEKINGEHTLLQNVTFEVKCKPPYVTLRASRGIKPGEELYVDYGPDYDYVFMKDPDVRAFLLKAANIPPGDAFTWDYSEEAEE